jgi:hypothetical protein
MISSNIEEVLNTTPPLVTLAMNNLLKTFIIAASVVAGFVGISSLTQTAQAAVN